MRRLIVGLYYPALAGVAISIRSCDDNVWSKLGSQVWYGYVAILILIGLASLVHLAIDYAEPASLLSRFEADTTYLWSEGTTTIYISFGGWGIGSVIFSTEL